MNHKSHNHSNPHPPDPSPTGEAQQLHNLESLSLPITNLLDILSTPNAHLAFAPAPRAASASPQSQTAAFAQYSDQPAAPPTPPIPSAPSAPVSSQSASPAPDLGRAPSSPHPSPTLDQLTRTQLTTPAAPSGWDAPDDDDPALLFTLQGLTSFIPAWIWPGHIPHGHLTLLDGDPGCGKSLLALTIAAAFSSGQPLLGAATTTSTQGPILLVSPYDHPYDAIRPRLVAAGADLSRIFLLQSVRTTDAPSGIEYERPLCFPQDLKILENKIGNLEVDLVILDAFPDLLDPRATRLVLSELASMATIYGCAILILRTVRTRPSDLVRPIVTGSSAFRFARSALLVIPHPHDPQHFLLLHSRHCYSAPPPLLAYRITAGANDTPIIDWVEAPPPDLLPLLAGVSPRYSAQRYTILRCLQQSPVPLDAATVALLIGADEEPVRKMLQRMRLSGDLSQSQRGLYTIPGQPCLAFPTPIPEPPPAPHAEPQPPSALVSRSEPNPLSVPTHVTAPTVLPSPAQRPDDRADSTAATTASLITPPLAPAADTESTVLIHAHVPNVPIPATPMS